MTRSFCHYTVAARNYLTGFLKIFSEKVLAVLPPSPAGWLPPFLVVCIDLVNTRDTCGSWLASDGGGSGNRDAGITGLGAGKPAPTGFPGARKIQVHR
ncbi:hypothetical protein [Pseudomonas sp. B7(2017)]|uniref:hypothetical protein n=1 Tax=Pseudomonas sp. B7(2017) TaxID=1981712 RepID=UPI00111C515C|nr:hypothetical protein [Pseudomonas sp. B7(2017)]